jgi:hypothetical protein
VGPSGGGERGEFILESEEKERKEERKKKEKQSIRHRFSIEGRHAPMAASFAPALRLPSLR